MIMTPIPDNTIDTLYQMSRRFKSRKAMSSTDTYGPQPTKGIANDHTTILTTRLPSDSQGYHSPLSFLPGRRDTSRLRLPPDGLVDIIKIHSHTQKPHVHVGLVRQIPQQDL